MAKREAELNNNGINDDNSWLLPMRLRTLSLQQETAELQQVSESVIEPASSYSVPVDLTANALQLITLEPVK